MATTGQAETPMTKLNNCDSSSNSNSKLVNGDHNNHHQQQQQHHNHSTDSPENNNHNVMKSQDHQQQRYNNSYENHGHHPNQNQTNHRMSSAEAIKERMSDPSGGQGPPGGPEGHYPPQQPPPHQQQQQQQYQQYQPYRTGYEQQQQQQPGPPPPHHNSNQPPSEHPGYPQQHPGYPQQPPSMRFPGKPMPGPGPGGPSSYPGGVPRGGGYTGQSISQQPSGPTPTLNQLLQSSGGANPGAGANPSQRYPAPPPGSYDPHNPYSNNQGPPQSWPPPSNRPGPPPSMNSYAHPPPFQQQQQQQPLYRQSGPGGSSRSGGGAPGPPPGPGSQPYYHPGGYPPPPPQSPHYPAQVRYPSPGPGMRPPDNQQPPSHYPGQLPPGMGPESSGLASGPGNTSGDPPKSTPPPPPSPSLLGNHGSGQPPSPSQSPRSTPHPPNSIRESLPPPSSPSHRPQPIGSSPSNNNYPPPPDVAEVTGCNSNDSVGGANSAPGGVRPSPSPTGSASSRSMSPAVGNQNIPMPPRPSSSQSENAPRMSQSPMSGGAQGGSYNQPSMAPPPHHNMYQGGGKMGHGHGPGGPPQPHYPQQPNQPPHWAQQQQQQPQGQQGQQQAPGGYSGPRGPYPGPYPPPSQQPLPSNSPYSQRHPSIPNHVGGPNQYSPYPPQYPSQPSQQQQQQQPPQQQQQQPPQPPQQQWPPNGPNAGTPPQPGPQNSRSQSHYLKQHLQHKLGYGQQAQGGYPMGPPQSSSQSPSQTPPPPHPHHSHGGSGGPPELTENNSNSSNPPNIVSVGPDGANVDELSQQSTISNASGASGGDDGPSMPKLRPEGGSRNYPSTPQSSSAVPSPGAASMSSAQEEYAEMNSPGWPRTPASPGLNSHPPPPSEHYRGKNKVKKADSLNKLYDMDDNPERRMFLDKLIHFMEDHNNPITSCPTISKNPLDLFKLYFLVKERGGFLEVTRNKTWKDIAGSLGIGASSSAAYTLRKHYTKHLLPFECKFDRGGIDPQPLINQVETTGKKKGKGAVPVPSPGSSNSQDSFPGPNNNTNSSSMDGFNSPSSSNPYPGPYSQSGPNSGPGEYPPQGPSGPLNAGSGSTVPSPLARPPPSQQQGPGSQQTDAKSGVSVSNPFDDMPPASSQYPYQQNRLNYQNSYPPYSSQPPSSGYQGPPPGSYPPYQGNEGYPPGRPPIPGPPPHDGGYPGQQPGQGYPPQGQPGGYPSRPIYPPYGDGPNSGPNSNSGSGPPPSGPGTVSSSYPSSSSSSSSGGPSQTSSNSGEDSNNRYNSMAPPPPSSAPPSGPNNNTYSSPRGPYPPVGPPPSVGSQGPPLGASAGQQQQHPPPPNGYPGQDYYHSQAQTEQGYPGMGQGSQGPSLGGKPPPPPPPNQQMRYPPGKEGSLPPPGPYPGYPSQSQAPQQRGPSYGDGQSARVAQSFSPYSSSVSTSGGANRSDPVRSSPSPSPAPTPPPPAQPTLPQTKPWIPPPPEGWPASGGGGGHYPGQQRGYPPSGGGPPIPPSQSVTTPLPAQSPGAPGQVGPGGSGPPTPSGQSWGSPSSSIRPTGPPIGSPWPQGEGRYVSSGGAGSMMSPPPSSGVVSGQGQVPPPWTTPQSRSQAGRPPFPGKPGSELYANKGYGGPQQQSMPPSSASPASAGPLKGPGQPIYGIPPSHPQHPQAQQQGPLPHPQQIQQQQQQQQLQNVPQHPSSSPQQQQHHQMKKEISFPLESVEAVTPVFTRRKKLHKNDVAPVEAWRIMMCLKSGLLAETTWALDVLNVLLYDDHSISYFSLTYLPGLLDILLEHLRRALILMFGQSVGIEISGDKLDMDYRPPEKQGKWFEGKEKDSEDDLDVGSPLKKFPRDCHRTLVLKGTTNYTMLSRVSKKTVGIVSRDEEPFILPGPRDWDNDEKSRNDPEIETLTGTMDLTKHIVTYFSSDLKNLPLIRDLKVKDKSSDNKSNFISQQSDTTVAVVKVTSDSSFKSEDDDEEEEELDLEMYRCETKLATEIVPPPQLSNSNPGTPKKSENSSNSSDVKPLTSTIITVLAPPSIEKEKKNCLLTVPPLISNVSSPINFSASNSKLTNMKKGKRLDDVLGRLCKKEPTESDSVVDTASVVISLNSRTSSSSMAAVEDENAMSESPIIVVKEPTTSTSAVSIVLENGCGGDSVGVTECSNLSAANSNSEETENTCDSSTNKPSSLLKCTVVQMGELLVRDPGCSLKRKRMEDLEDECYTRDESSLYLVTESQDSLARRCLSICNIIRNLTFVPGNDVEFGKCVSFLSLIGKLILLHHEHPVKSRLKLEEKKVQPQEKEEEEEEENIEDGGSSRSKEEIVTIPVVDEDEDGLLFSTVTSVDIDADSCTSLCNEDEWWWDYVHHLREHVLVMIANISGQMDLSQFSEEISRPILDGLLHWAVCPAAYGQDPFPTLNPGASLSPQRLAIEALCKLSVIQGNVDLLLATPPYSRIEKLCQLLCRSLCRTEEQVMREFSLNLLFYLSAADTGVARTIALQNPCISLLISFIEQAEHNAMNIANSHGFAVLRENPEAMGTSLDMLRRAATTLLNLARHPDNRSLFVQHEPRLLQLVMSQILEQKVAAMVAQVLFQCSTPEGPNSQKYFYSSSSSETFYTPLFSRSRSVVPHPLTN